MSVRRCIDAGWSPWAGFAVVLPVINLITALILSIAPSDPEGAAALGENARGRKRKLQPSARWSIFGLVFGTATGIAMVAFSTLVLKSYGSVLFVATPICVGAIVGFLTNLGGGVSVPRTLSLVTLSTIMAATGLLAFGLEGMVCIIIIAPIVIVPAIFGALLGRMVALALQSPDWHPDRSSVRVSLLVLLLPLLAAAERDRFPTATFEVVSHIEVDAPPDVVWKHVVSFSELPEPDDLIFKLGVAHPKRARIDGTGVGAVRHCEFSTGPFVEPITAWEPPTRLAFDVTEQPVPMHEWSPYRDLHPPHLDGYIRSQGGEFRLVALPGERTRLEGSTWYELDLFPQLYFRAWADAFIHRVHMLVLEHVKRLSEASGG